MTVELTFALPRQRRAVGEARRLVTTVLNELGAPDEHVEVIALALSEACTNAVEHSAGHGPFTLRVECDAASVKLAVTSPGRFSSDRDRSPMPGASALRGRGVPLMRMLMDQFEILAGDAGTTISMCKNMRFEPTPVLLA